MSTPAVRWWKTDLGAPEIDRVTDAIRNRHVNHGPLCGELEARVAAHLGVPHVVTTTSGSVALLLALIAAEVGPGDEVILPASAFIAAAHAALLLGARLRLVDVQAGTQVMDATLIEAAITEKTRGIIAVHMNGHACDLPVINGIAARHGLRVIEDAAQAFCSRNRCGYLGTQSDAGTFSMGITKLMTTGEGGFLAVHSDDTYARLVALRNHGVRSIADNVFETWGCNFRLTDLQAAVGLAQLQQLPGKIAAVQRVHRFYRAALADLPQVTFLEAAVDDGALPLWCQILCDQRDLVAAQLAQRGIETRPFHPALVDSPHLHVDGKYPNACAVAARGLTLPSGPDQPEDSLQRTVDALRAITRQLDAGEAPSAPLGARR
jgi:perosamine synthetase